jgi:FkbM family methyltransferase
VIPAWLERLRRLARVALDPDDLKTYFVEMHARQAQRGGRGAVLLEGHLTHFQNAHHLAILYQEIFLKQVYDFETSVERPIVIDCGANIGLSTIRFKRRHPAARVYAFEPDPGFASILEKNIESWGLGDVTVIQSAVWSSEGTMRFQPDEGLAGHLGGTVENDGIEVKTVRLRHYLSEPIDFLKIDIEGAELEVLKDCADALKNVRRLFVEWHSYGGQQQTLDAVLEILRGADYRYWIQRIESPSRPFLETGSAAGKLDMCVNICATRATP